MRAMRGFTLIEIMIAMVIVAILAAIGIPAYRDYIIRTNRGDATAALLKIAAAQEKFYLQNDTYTTNLAAPPAGLGIPNTDAGYYDLAVTAADADGFTATATAIAGEAQASDDECQTFTITQQNVRTSTPSAADVCWR
ncbi:MAG: type IV pilin protein [Gammaproteobacteria bacterium]